MMKDLEKACDGGRTVRRVSACMDFEECIACGKSVRWDLVVHPFFGFRNCSQKSQPPIPEPQE